MKKSVAFFLLLLLFKNSHAQVANKTDSLALIDLYNNTGGSNWYNRFGSKAWLSGAVNNWAGVSLNNSGRVVSLDLSYNNLKGSLPSTLGNFTMLTSLILNGNLLSGGIPASITSLSNLTIVDFSNNKLTGIIPSNIGSLTKLVKLNFRANQLSGTIPNSVTSLTNLTDLSFGFNQLSGSIPNNIGNLTKLYTLNLYSNSLTGNIPNSIGNMTSLEQINLYSNKLSGAIPSTISNLQNVTSIQVYDNKFTFAGMELVANFVFSQQSGGSGSRNYSQQAIIPLSNKKNVLSVSVGGNFNNNSFDWYKDGNLIGTTYGDSTFTAAKAGKYWVVATNSVCSALTLYSDTLTVYNLPISLSCFTAQAKNEHILLNWQTATELNASDFVIEQSLDGKIFTPRGTVKAVGAGTNAYEYIDNTPNNGINYYRLKMVDKDGSFSYSKVVLVQLSMVNCQLSISPNPAKETVHLKIYSDKNGKSTLRFINSSGKVIKQQNIVLQAGANYLTIDISALASGYYQVLLKTDNNLLQQQLIKE